MPEEIKSPPPSGDTGVKTAEQLMAELKIANEKATTLEKQVKDKDEFIGKQSTEIGELRKNTEKPQETVTSEIEDTEIKELTEDFKKKGMDEETAKFNAEILIGFDRKRTSKKIMSDTTDLIIEAIDENRIEKKIFDENKDDAIAEYNTRKLTLSPRQNFKIFKDCLDIVVKKKADKLKQETKETEEEKRARLIAEQAQPSGGGVKPTAEEDTDKKARESISGAGVKRDSVFF